MRCEGSRVACMCLSGHMKQTGESAGKSEAEVGYMFDGERERKQQRQCDWRRTVQWEMVGSKTRGGPHAGEQVWN